MNTIENNKIIAEFMSSVYDEQEKLYYFNTIVYKSGKNYFNQFELKFDTSWDWLMEVVEKIESLEVEGKQWSVLNDEDDVIWNFEVNINSKQCVINRCAFDGDEEDFLNLYDCRNYQNITKKEATYNACVEFIKWYNEQKN